MKIALLCKGCGDIFPSTRIGLPRDMLGYCARTASRAQMEVSTMVTYLGYGIWIEPQA